MQLPLQIAFHNVPRTPEFEDLIEEHAETLDEFHRHIMSCRVVVDMPHRHHEHGNLYQVRIDLKVPGEEIAITRQPPQHEAYRDLRVAVRDAFDEARRKLEDYARRQRGATKQHESQPHARVAKIFPQAGYGFLEAADGRNVYFHRDSLVGCTLEALQIGTEVTFVEELGDKGPQASTVTPVGRHHHASSAG